MNLMNFKEILGAEDKYKILFNFKDMLKRSQKEINEKTDIEIIDFVFSEKYFNYKTTKTIEIKSKRKEKFFKKIK